MNAKLLLTTATLALAAISTVANANPTGPSCTVDGASDPTIGSTPASDCVGYFSGNLLATSSAQTQSNFALFPTSWSAGTPTYLEKYNLASGVTSQTFTTDLTGTVILGIHWGGDAGGGQTAFYYWNDLTASNYVVNFAGQNPGGSSGIELFVAGGTPVNVPLPGTLTLMSLALLGLGATVRRRKV